MISHIMKTAGRMWMASLLGSFRSVENRPQRPLTIARSEPSPFTTSSVFPSSVRSCRAPASAPTL
ncbi:hypothetical protein, partial [Klebsiella pneumoniae]|uniref:hypothetical protein n=1 Tax=Klebsiella pneumoniae TaxID=573 RepID=UPI0034D1D908